VAFRPAVDGAGDVIRRVVVPLELAAGALAAAILLVLAARRRRRRA
jgi:hypothetical protein